MECFDSIGRELKSPAFDIVEHAYVPSSSDNACVDSTKAPNIDVARTFSPNSRYFLGGKVIILIWALATFDQSIDQSDHPSFWLAYLTHWGLLFSVAYFVASVSTAISISREPPMNNELGLLAKITWALFAIAFPGELIITILYWTLEFDGDVGYVSIMVHAGLFILLFIDGTLLSRIPLRMKQFVFFEIFSLSWVIWSIIHALASVGNPYKDDGTQDDDAIYASVRWRENTQGSVILVLLVLFVANPIAWVVCWALSRLPKMRLVNDESFKETRSTNDEEAPDNVQVD